MKKFTLMLIAALMVVVTFAGVPMRKSATISPRQLPVERHFVSARKAMPVSRPMSQANPKLKKAVRQASPRKVSTIDELMGDWMLLSGNYILNDDDELEPAVPAYGGTPVTITSKAGTTLEISGFTSEAENAIVASVDLEEGIISIADGQTLFESDDYGPVILCNAEEEGAPITCTINADGTIEVNQTWYALIGGDGDYAGEQWSYYQISSFVPVNGTMTWGEKEEKVYIFQDPENPKYVSIYNFAGEETAITARLKTDKTFYIDEQPVYYYDEDYGYIYVSGLTISNGNYYIDALTGVGNEKTLTFSGNWMLYSPAKGSIFDSFEPATITLTQGEFAYPEPVPDVAATPADPSVLEVGNYDATDGYGYVAFTIPTVDVNGNDLDEAKLSYQLYSDIQGVCEPIVFKPEICEKLTEEMSIIPYTFTDNWDFVDKGSYKMVFLNYNFSTTYDRIGVKSIYTAGGETNETEIQWLEIEKASVGDELTFDFNSMDVPTSQNGITDGDIKEAKTLTEGLVSLTISPKTGGNTENRFWNSKSGPQLRVYSGTLTFEVPDGYVMTSIVFNATKWNEGNTADSGEIDGTTWTGEAQEVVFSIAGNTQIDAITITLAEGEGGGDDDEGEVVTPPADLATDVYLFKSKIKETDYDDDGNPIEGDFEEYENQVLVGFDADDLYIQGISEDFPDAWVKATKNEAGKYVIPANQYLGSLDVLGIYELDFFFTAIDDDDNLIDVVLTLDPETGTITTNQTLALNGAQDELDCYFLFEGATFTKMKEIAAVPADPEILEVLLTADDDNDPHIEFYIPTKSVDGEELIMSKLFYQIFFEKDGVVQPLTLTTDLYQYLEENMTVIPYTYDDDYDIYAGSCVFLNQDDEELNSWTKIGLQTINTAGGEEHKSQIVWYDLTNNYDDPTVIASVTTDGQARYYDLQGRFASASQKGLLIKQVLLQDGTVKTTKELRK